MAQRSIYQDGLPLSIEIRRIEEAFALHPRSGKMIKLSDSQFDSEWTIEGCQPNAFFCSTPQLPFNKMTKEALNRPCWTCNESVIQEMVDRDLLEYDADRKYAYPTTKLYAIGNAYIASKN